MPRRKDLKVYWRKLGKQLQSASAHEGLDDVMVLDLSFLCRRMQPAVEMHHKCVTFAAASCCMFPLETNA